LAFTDTPDPIVATLTDIGRLNIARATMGEISFVLKGFAVGRLGYNSTNPVKITPIDPTQVALGDQFFPVTGNKPLEMVEKPTPATVVANCRLASDEAVSALGEIGLYAEIIHSSVSSAEIGTEFLLALGHFPIQTKTLRQAVVFRFIIQF
jgi:hypothetical protein